MSRGVSIILNLLLLIAGLLVSLLASLLFSPQPLLETASYVILLTLLFLRGPLIGTTGTFGIGLLLESLSNLPLGRMLFLASLCGLFLLHLSRKTEWSAVGRGLCCCLLGSFFWCLLLEFFQSETVFDFSLISQLLWRSLWQAVLTGTSWLLLTVITSGFRVVWRDSFTRPIHYGNDC